MFRISAVRAYIRRWAEPAVIATIAVAILAFLIQRDLANQEELRSAVSRSVAIYQDFVNSTATQYLQDVQHEIEELVWIDKESKGEIKAVTVFKENKILKKEQLIRSSIVAVIQRINLLYDCGNYKSTFENKSMFEIVLNKLSEERPLCDRKSISTLLGATFTELFFTFRPVLYCDKFFTDRYYQKGDIDGYIGRWESLVLDYMRRSTEGKKFPIVREETDLKTLRLTGRETYAALRATQSRCNLYLTEKPA